MNPRPFVLVVLLALLLPVPPVTAAGPLEQIPDSAFIVMRFDSIDRATSNFKEMVGAIGPAAAPASEGLEEGLAEILELRVGREIQLDAIDRKATVYVALFPLFDSRYPPAVYFVKTKDEAKVRRAVLGIGDGQKVKLVTKKRDDGFTEVSREGNTRKFYFAKRDDYLVYIRSPEVLERMAQTPSKGRTIADALGSRGLKVLNAGDMAMAFHATQVVEKHKEDIENARKSVYDFIEAVPDEQLATSGSPKAIKAMYTTMAKVAFDGVYDINWAAGNVRFGPDGARGEGLVGVKKFSLSDWVLLANQPAPLANLELLPAKQLMYYGLKINSHLMMEFTRGSMALAYGGDLKDEQAMASALEQMAQAKLGSTVASFAFPTDAKTGMRATAFSEAALPEKLAGSYGEFFKAFGGAIENPLFEQSFDFKEAAEKYKKHVIHLMTMKIKLKKEDDAQAIIMGKMFEQLYGGNGLQSRIAVLEKLIIQTTGNDAKIFQSVLDSLESGEGVIGLEKSYGKTRDELAKEANLIVMLNGPQAVLDVVNLLKNVIPGFNLVLDASGFNFNLKPPVSYGGMSVTAEPQGLRFKGFIPVEQPRGILQIFAPGL